MPNPWSGLRKQLENDFLCEKLRGRIQYFITHYHKAPDNYGRIAIRIDGHEQILGNPYSYCGKGYYFIERQMKKAYNIPRREWTSKGIVYENENIKIEKEVKKIAVNDGVFEIYDITDAIRMYTQSPIIDSVFSDNPIVRMFAVLDRRIGKRTLIKLADNIEIQPKWLQFFYKLRLDAENISYSLVK